MSPCWPSYISDIVSYINLKISTPCSTPQEGEHKHTGNGSTRNNCLEAHNVQVSYESSSPKTQQQGSYRARKRKGRLNVEIEQSLTVNKRKKVASHNKFTEDIADTGTEDDTGIKDNVSYSDGDLAETTIKDINCRPSNVKDTRSSEETWKVKDWLSWSNDICQSLQLAYVHSVPLYLGVNLYDSIFFIVSPLTYRLQGYDMDITTSYLLTIALTKVQLTLCHKS